MLTLLDINRAIDRLGRAAFVPRTQQYRLAYVPIPGARVSIGRPRGFPLPQRTRFAGSRG